MKHNEFLFNEKKLGPISKKALKELVDDGQLKKEGTKYLWTDKGMKENQKIVFRLHNVWLDGMPKKPVSKPKTSPFQDKVIPGETIPNSRPLVSEKTDKTPKSSTEKTIPPKMLTPIGKTATPKKPEEPKKHKKPKKPLPTENPNKPDKSPDY